MVHQPQFLSLIEAPEPTLCLVRKLLCIQIIFIFRFEPEHPKAIFLGAVFLVQKLKTSKRSYIKITFSNYVGNSQDSADLCI